MLDTDLTRLLHIRFPIIQAPMAGGPTTPTLVAAVSNAGGLGSLGAAYLAPEHLRSEIHKIRQLTDRPFGVNLFVPENPKESKETISKMTNYLNKYRTKLGISHNPSILKYQEEFQDQVQVILEEKIPVFSFTFGIPSQSLLEEMKSRKIVVIGTATTVDEARLLEQAGVDAIVAQGSESGGHRGTFLKDSSHSLIGTMALVPQIVDQASIPVIASGGIMDGRGLVSSLVLGAAAVQMGTAFLACPESGAHRVYKQKVLLEHEDATEVTRAYSGKDARGIRTTFMNEMQHFPSTIPAFPIQNAMTKDIRQAAAKANNSEYMSLWAGQGLRLATDHPAETIVQLTVDQARKILKEIASMNTFSKE
ncbi:nitronate monooxygenase [Shimazuella sp. AN120528]|uniref:NAD(P)H-dependent flavin oxidoreductase n=1 Tax=Shimazuella soli TaxID=1892854 RepID=UPI001F0ED77F|nr:nitronate monooxygenase [Shimazuella soli]MCH5586632.1 nitronate monooxygenase [Shimazuella soli]